MAKVAIITGSNGGIGRSLCKKFIDDDYKVIAIDKRFDKRFNISHSMIEVDLQKFIEDGSTKKTLINKIKNLLPKKINKLVLINNAAVQILNPLQKIKLVDLDKTFKINTFSSLFLIKELLGILAKYSANIVNISSIHAKQSKKDFIAYAASKAALESITKNISIELAQFGISINCVSPAAIDTNMLKEGLSPKKLKELKSFHPTNSIGNPEELATFVKNISEQDGNFLNGAVLNFDGAISNLLNDPNQSSKK